MILIYVSYLTRHVVSYKTIPLFVVPVQPSKPVWQKDEFFILFDKVDNDNACVVSPAALAFEVILLLVFVASDDGDDDDDFDVGVGFYTYILYIRCSNLSCTYQFTIITTRHTTCCSRVGYHLNYYCSNKRRFFYSLMTRVELNDKLLCVVWAVSTSRPNFVFLMQFSIIVNAHLFWEDCRNGKSCLRRNQSNT